MDLRKFVASLVLSFSAGAIGGFFTVTVLGTWYSALNKPWFNPPNWVFGPVWTLLYFLMAVSLYLVWVSKAKEKKLALGLFFLQIVLNTLWSIVFFGLNDPRGGLLVILALEASIFACIYHFRQYSMTAALLLVPYAAWVAFATLLNYAIMTLN